MRVSGESALERRLRGWATERRFAQSPPKPLPLCCFVTWGWGVGGCRRSVGWGGPAHARKHTPDPVPAFDCISTFPRRLPSVSSLLCIPITPRLFVFFSTASLVRRADIHARQGSRRIHRRPPPVEPAISALMPGERLQGGWSRR